MKIERYLSTIIQPGDILLYDRQSLGSWFIKFKRGEKYSHVAIASYPGLMLEAIQGDVLDERPLRLDGLAAIYRVSGLTHKDFAQGYKWFTTVRGQKYDWVGLLSFAWARFQGRQNDKMFCSEFVARFFKKINKPLFSEMTDSDAVSPGMIPYSPRVFPRWLRSDKKPKHGNLQ